LPFGERNTENRVERPRIHGESRDRERVERQREIYMYTREIGEFEFFLRGLWVVPMRNGEGGVRLLGV
jgi:hypothetical protein